MVRSRALKRRVERRRWDTTLLNAMVWDPRKPTPVTRGRPLKVRNDREPISMGPIPRVHFNLPDDPDTATTAAAVAGVPSQETTLRETTQPVAERTRVKPAEAGAEGAPVVQRTRTAVSVLRPQPRRLLRPQQHLQQGHSLSAFETRLEKTHNPSRCAESRQSWQSARTPPRQMQLKKNLEKLRKVKDAAIKAVPRTDATTRPLTGRWVDSVHDGERKARWTTRGYEQTLDGD